MSDLRETDKIIILGGESVKTLNNRSKFKMFFNIGERKLEYLDSCLRVCGSTRFYREKKSRTVMPNLFRHLIFFIGDPETSSG